MPISMSRYAEELVAPMRKELTDLGVEELLTPERVDEIIKKTPGTVMVIVNSVCGCAAGGARPGIRKALNNHKRPGLMTTVFAGVDIDATKKAREYFVGYAPSSPSVALFKDGKIVYMMERFQIEGRLPEMIADDLISAFNKYC